MGRRLDEILRLCAGRHLRAQVRLGGLESRFTLAVAEVRPVGGASSAVTFVGGDGTSSLTVLEEEIAGLRPADAGEGWIISLDGGTELRLEPDFRPGA